jgi:hypothetical protein
VPIKRNERKYESNERECRKYGVWIGHEGRATGRKSERQRSGEGILMETSMKSVV